MWIRLTLVLALAACSDAPAGKVTTKRQDRQAAAEAALAKTPEPRSYRFDGNELKIIDVPVKDASGFLDLARCFVWRDAEFRTASLSCGTRPDVILSDR
jgi:hypothetical protein